MTKDMQACTLQVEGSGRTWGVLAHAGAQVCLDALKASGDTTGLCCAHILPSPPQAWVDQCWHGARAPLGVHDEQPLQRESNLAAGQG